MRNRHLDLQAALVLLIGCFSLVLLRGYAASQDYHAPRSVIALDGANVSTLYGAAIDPVTSSITFARLSRREGIGSIDFLVPMTDYAHFLRPAFKRHRRIIAVVPAAEALYGRSRMKVTLNGKLVGEVPSKNRLSEADGLDFADPFKGEVPYVIDLSPSESPPAETWHVRVEAPSQGAILNRLVIEIYT
jgi:hypothetical protein